MITLKLERSVKHSHLYKADDGTNAYIKKDALPSPPPSEVVVLTQEEHDSLRA